MPDRASRFYWPDKREIPIAAALLLLCLTPLIIALSKPAAALLLMLCASLLVFFIWREGALGELVDRVRRFWASPAGWLLIALLLWLCLSILWSEAPRRGAEYTAHMIICAWVAVAAIHAARMSFAHPFTGYFLAGIVAAALWMLANSAFDRAPTETLGIMRVLTNFNRACVALALLLPLLAEVARVTPSFLAVACTACAAIVTISTGTSESAKLAMILGLLIVVIGRYAAYLARIMRVVIPAAILFTPLYAGIIGDLVPRSIHERFGYVTVTVRAEMWGAYAALVPEHWLRGFGVETSAVMAQSPLAAGFPDKVRGLLEMGHPHHAPLQVWVELGLPGALLVAGLVFLYFHWAASLTGRELRLAVACGVQACAIAFVSHGAWQVWWYALCVLVAMLTLLMLKTLPERRGV